MTRAGTVIADGLTVSDEAVQIALPLGAMVCTGNLQQVLKPLADVLESPGRTR